MRDGYIRQINVLRVVDGDTLDVTIDCGFDIWKKERIRLLGIDAPEIRTRDLEEKAAGLESTKWLKDRIAEAVCNRDYISIKSEKK